MSFLFVCQSLRKRTVTIQISFEVFLYQKILCLLIYLCINQFIYSNNQSICPLFLTISMEVEVSKGPSEGQSILKAG